MMPVHYIIYEGGSDFSTKSLGFSARLAKKRVASCRGHFWTLFWTKPLLKCLFGPLFGAPPLGPPFFGLFWTNPLLKAPWYGICSFWPFLALFGRFLVVKFPEPPGDPPKPRPAGSPAWTKPLLKNGQKCPPKGIPLVGHPQALIWLKIGPFPGDPLFWPLL